MTTAAGPAAGEPAGARPTPAAGQAGGWSEITFQADPSLHDRLLLEAAAPLLTPAAAEPTAGRGLFLRELGRSAQPKLILQVDTTGHGPGRADGLAERARQLAAAIGPVTVTAAPASVVPLAGTVFSGPALAPVGRCFLSAVTPTLLNVAAAAAVSRSARFSAALDLMAAHVLAVVCSRTPGSAELADDLGGIPLSFLSFRSHAEAFFATSRDPLAARQAMDSRYEAARACVESRVSAVLAQVRGHAPVVSEPAQHWYDIASATKPLAAEQFRAGGIAVEADPSGDHPGGDLMNSRFHQAVAASEELRAFLGGDPDFLASRLLTSLLYLSLHNLGVSLVERYLLCHLTARACEALSGTDGMTVIARMTAGSR